LALSRAECQKISRTLLIDKSGFHIFSPPAAQKAAGS
jgi:hypothetical protein